MNTFIMKPAPARIRRVNTVRPVRAFTLIERGNNFRFSIPDFRFPDDHQVSANTSAPQRRGSAQSYRAKATVCQSDNPESKISRALRGFTLIELLTVIAIIGILAAIIIPTVGKVRQSARQAQATSNLRQIGVTILLISDDNKDRFPPAETSSLKLNDGGTISNKGVGYYLMPYMNCPTIAAFNRTRLMVDPLIDDGTIAPKGSSTFGQTWSGNRRLMGTAIKGSQDLSDMQYSIGYPGVRRSAVSRPSQVVMLGSAVTKAGTEWGAYNVFTKPSEIVSGANIDAVVAAESGNTEQEGGNLNGIAYRASGGNAAMFVMADGSVKTIRKGEIRVGHFAAEL